MKTYKEFPMTFSNLPKRPIGVLDPYKPIERDAGLRKATYDTQYKIRCVQHWRKSKLDTVEYSKRIGISRHTFGMRVRDPRFNRLLKK